MRQFIVLLVALAPVSAAAQAVSGTPDNMGEINRRFERLKGLNLEMEGRWPNNPYRGTAQGAPTAITSARDAAAPDAAKREFNKGLDALQKADGKNAASHFEKATELYSKFVSAYNNLAVALMYMGQNDQAHAALNKAVEIDNRAAPAYLNLSRLSLLGNDFEHADTYAQKAAELDPNAESLTVLSLTRLFNNKNDETVDLARRVHALEHQRYAIAHLLAGQALQKSGKPEEAAAEYKLFLKEDPSNPRAPLARQALQDLSKR